MFDRETIKPEDNTYSHSDVDQPAINGALKELSERVALNRKETISGDNIANNLPPSSEVQEEEELRNLADFEANIKELSEEITKFDISNLQQNSGDVDILMQKYNDYLNKIATIDLRYRYREFKTQGKSAPAQSILQESLAEAKQVLREHFKHLVDKALASNKYDETARSDMEKLAVQFGVDLHNKSNHENDDLEAPQMPNKSKEYSRKLIKYSIKGSKILAGILRRLPIMYRK